MQSTPVRTDSHVLPVVTEPMFTRDMPWARTICRLKMHRKKETLGVVAWIWNVRAVEVEIGKPLGHAAHQPSVPTEL